MNAVNGAKRQKSDYLYRSLFCFTVDGRTREKLAFLPVSRCFFNLANRKMARAERVLQG